MMGPRIPVHVKPGESIAESCNTCGLRRPSDDFIKVKSWMYPNGRIPICNDCIEKKFEDLSWKWDKVDRFLQWIDIPFIPAEFERLKELNGSKVIPIYVRMFQELRYSALDWSMYYQKFLELKDKQKLDLELPGMREDYFNGLRLRWGPEYDEEALLYLENLYNGILSGGGVSGALQTDQAQKLCKMSWLIEERIRAGADIDKLIGSYDKLSKIADITSKTTGSSSDFGSMGEVVAWLEKRGWMNPYYSSAKQDIVDETIKSSEAFVQRLYVNETGLAEEIEERIEQLKIAAEVEKGDSALADKAAEIEEDPFFELDAEEQPDGSINHDALEMYGDETYRELMVDDILDSDTTRI